jgi:hypothetical protein
MKSWRILNQLDASFDVIVNLLAREFKEQSNEECNCSFAMQYSMIGG